LKSKNRKYIKIGLGLKINKKIKGGMIK